jgi:hypothetical protein
MLRVHCPPYVNNLNQLNSIFDGLEVAIVGVEVVEFVAVAAMRRRFVADFAIGE